MATIEQMCDRAYLLVSGRRPLEGGALYREVLGVASG
jgi:hypothetical protein